MLIDTMSSENLRILEQFPQIQLFGEPWLTGSLGKKTTALNEAIGERNTLAAGMAAQNLELVKCRLVSGGLPTENVIYRNSQGGRCKVDGSPLDQSQLVVPDMRQNDLRMRGIRRELSKNLLPLAKMTIALVDGLAALRPDLESAATAENARRLGLYQKVRVEVISAMEKIGFDAFFSAKVCDASSRVASTVGPPSGIFGLVDVPRGQQMNPGAVFVGEAFLAAWTRFVKFPDYGYLRVVRSAADDIIFISDGEDDK